MPYVRNKRRAPAAAEREGAVRVPEPASVDGADLGDSGQTSYWRTHTYCNGYEQELDVGMVEHVMTDKDGKEKIVRYSVGVIK